MMKNQLLFPTIFVLGALISTTYLGACAPTSAEQPVATNSATPQDGRWEKDIQAFEVQDKKSPPSADAALFIGSSSIRLWDTLAQDFPEIPVINRGFGGSRIAHSTRYADRIVIPYKPRLIVMFAGGNDLEMGKTPAQVCEAFQAFVTKVRDGLPNVTIAYISINPSLQRWDDHDKIIEANRLIAQYIQDKPNLAFIDSYNPLLGADGLPQKSLLRADGLHLNKAGYEAWTDIVKPKILKLYRGVKP